MQIFHLDQSCDFDYLLVHKNHKDMANTVDSDQLASREAS